MTESDIKLISEFKEKHGDRYDYSKVTARVRKDKVIIGCRVHGDFNTTTADSHLSGVGCPLCGIARRSLASRLTTEEFITRSALVHAGRYGYDKTVYTKLGEPVTILCPVHGDFKQKPENHLGGAGCYRCGRLSIDKSNAKSTEYFVAKAKRLHGNLYGYSKSEYVDVYTPVVITCVKHGDFKQRPFDHYAMCGCKRCAVDKRVAATRLDPTYVLNKIKSIYNDKYDYSQFSYVNDDTKVTLICPVHGRFDKSYRVLLNGIGCTDCHHDSLSLTTPQFVIRSNVAHDHFFDYSKATCNRGSDKVIIGCPVHGDFVQTAVSHANGVGCSQCSTDRGRVTVEEFIERGVKTHSGKYSYEFVVFVNVSKNVTITCPVHGNFLQTPDSHMRGKGCKACGREVMRHTEDEYKAMVITLHGDMYGLDRLGYKTLEHPVHIECQKHGLTLIKKAQHLLRGSGCPKCSGSHTEKLIGGYLQSLGVEYDREFVIPGYRYRYDFALLHYPVLIEYHGEQHYTPVAIYGGAEALVKRQAADAVKVELARKSGYKLIVLSCVDMKNGRLKESVVRTLLSAGVKLRL